MLAKEIGQHSFRSVDMNCDRLTDLQRVSFPISTTWPPYIIKGGLQSPSIQVAPSAMIAGGLAAPSGFRLADRLSRGREGLCCKRPSAVRQIIIVTD